MIIDPLKLDITTVGCWFSGPELKRSHATPKVLSSSPFGAGSWMHTDDESHNRIRRPSTAFRF